MNVVLGLPRPRCPWFMFSQHKTLCSELKVSEAVTSKLQSAGDDLVSDRWRITVELLVWHVATPMYVQGLAEHPGVGAVDGFLLGCVVPFMMNCQGKKVLQL